MDFTGIPKIENHVHLEGAIPYETLWQLIQKYGGDRSVSSLQQLEEKFIFRDFNHFIETWIWKNGFLREYEDFRLISEAVFRDLASQNVKYAEVFISPSAFRENLDVRKIVEAVSESMGRNPEIRVSLVVDFVRNHGQEIELRTLTEINEVKDLGIIGIGIGGSEKEFPPELFTDLFEKARNFGFRTTAHAGEAAGADSIWKAIRYLNVDRIGHGTRATEDPVLLDYLAEHRIPVELCPMSNLRTRVISSLDEHPFQTFLERGIPVSINTDDPRMFGNSLAQEYQALADTFNMDVPDIWSVIKDSIKTTWLSRDEQAKLIEDFNNKLTIQRQNEP
jgi:adenosine deaminase